MGKLVIELPYNYDEVDINSFFMEHNWNLLKSQRNESYWIKIGDAIKASNGVIAAVVATLKNEVQEPFIVIANKKFSSEELYEIFYSNARSFTVPNTEISCPECGSHKFDTCECSECGHIVFNK